MPPNFTTQPLLLSQFHGPARQLILGLFLDAYVQRRFCLLIATFMNGFVNGELVDFPSKVLIIRVLCQNTLQTGQCLIKLGNIGEPISSHAIECHIFGIPLDRHLQIFDLAIRYFQFRTGLGHIGESGTIPRIVMQIFQTRLDDTSPVLFALSLFYSRFRFCASNA